MDINQCPSIHKEYIFEALMILMNDKDFDDITITDIARKAGVSRMTYYRYYSNKEDIIRVHIRDIFDMVNDYIEEREDKSAEKLFEFYYARMNSEKSFVRNLVSSGLIGKFKQEIAAFIRLMIDGVMIKAANDYMAELYSSFVVGGIIALNILVSESDREYSIDDLVFLTMNMMRNSLNEKFTDI